jgi:hypothetical protein
MPTGRFQSRFFSFFSQQSLRLRDKTSQAWRQMQITAAWGAQILLYPIYAAFQTTRLVSRQMGQAVRQVIPQLQAAKQSSQLTTSTSQDAPLALTSDTPIQNTLQAIDEIIQSLPATAIAAQLKASESSTNGAIERYSTAALQTSTNSKPSVLSVQGLHIRGIASSLDTRELVLVTVENQLLNILMPEQQHHLQQRLVWELVIYHQQRRALSSPRFTNFLPLPSDRPNALFPIRVFYRLMAWMQTTPIAIATNLFQESQLALLHAAETEALAQLPAATSQRSPQLPWLSLDAALSGLFDRPAPSSGQLAPAHSPDSAATTPPKPTSQPWLTWENLFNHQSVPSPSSEWDVFNPAPKSKLVRRKPATVTRSDRAKQPGNLVAPSPEEVLSPTAFTPQETNLVPSETPVTENGISSTWVDVEAEVKLVAYVKHPLEQLLDWLDRGMVWIEEKLAKTLTWLRDRLP